MIEIEKNNQIAQIILNRPEKRNALSPELITALKEAFTALQLDDSIRVIILKANGKVFSAGADLAYLQQLQNNTFEDNLADSTHLMELFELMYHHHKIIIAQVEGSAIAGGCGLATVCDFVYSVPEAKFGYTEVKIGFIPAIVMFFLLRKIGEGRAKELLLTGKLFEANYAQKIGLINDVIEANQINDYVFNFAETLCKETSSEAVAQTRNMIASIQSMDTHTALRYAATQNAHARATDDCKKGINSFLNKEALIWS